MNRYKLILEYTDVNDKTFVSHHEKDFLIDDILKVIDQLPVKFDYKDIFDEIHTMYLSHIDYLKIGGYKA